MVTPPGTQDRVREDHERQHELQHEVQLQAAVRDAWNTVGTHFRESHLPEALAPPLSPQFTCDVPVPCA